MDYEKSMEVTTVKSHYTFSFYRQLDFSAPRLRFDQTFKQLFLNNRFLVDILVPNESSDRGESFKHLFAGRVSSFLSPLSKIAKQLRGSD